jgi:hypothetical protein
MGIYYSERSEYFGKWAFDFKNRIIAINLYLPDSSLPAIVQNDKTNRNIPTLIVLVCAVSDKTGETSLRYNQKIIFQGRPNQTCAEERAEL